MKKSEFTVRLLRLAEEDLTDLVSYIAADRPSAADAMLTKIETNLFLLCSHPHLGRVPDDVRLIRMGYRFLVVDNYLIFYTIEEKIILVHRILHGARDYLPLL